MTRTRHTLHAHDGHALTAYSHEPAQAVRATLVIGPAMAVPQSFYNDFAAFLAKQGYRVWTFDYRGMGESRHGARRACTANITDWVTLDYDAVLHHASAAQEGLPLFVLGHSLGGQTVPLLPSIEKVSGVINIAVGSGALRHNQPGVRRKAPLMWHVFTPLLCPVFGYFPGARIGVVGDIPRRVMYQWRHWCLQPDYLLQGEPGAREAYARVRQPVLGLTFTDDELLLESGSRMLHEAYRGAQVDYRELSPGQFGLKRIGHFGFFRREQEAILWPLVSDWLAQRLTCVQR
ncbi:alpha/beta fold hydrolase [Duganella sp. FT3S]|uniref:Alpha/beta fold hydrolase n=1 Tax=Rugamonas fusca TaxID=2758568 RepID=A0A7W2EIH5_9BURK|nr:alpha/beta fold hydrolase [Rugamonas fusca]MBA5606506.1 alpha/beta fold hydrolase [Rugamonas fusca]